MTKREFALIFTVMILVVLYLSKCKCSYSPKEGVVKVVTDTVWKSSKSDTFYTPQITKIEWRTKLQYKTDTLETFEYVVVDTSLIMQEYFAKRYYEDSIAVQYGKVYINDTVTENKIKSRGVRTNFNVPVVKETITLRQPNRNIGYITFGAKGSDQSFLEQTEVGFGWKSKNDKFYELNGALNREGILMGGFKIGVPIRLNKNK